MNRLLCYAHHDERGKVGPFVRHALSSMMPLCAGRIFVSNSPVADGDLGELRALCTKVIVTRNVGYDFHMWKLALQAEDYGRFDEVVLMNSSVYGPLFPMDKIFAEMGEVDCDFWGITECFRHLPHIQSYFLVFRKQVLSSSRFRLFWDSVLPYAEKRQVILGYEVGLSQWLMESGFRPAAYCDFDKLALQCGKTGKSLKKDRIVSSSHAAELLRAGSPFLKRDAVRHGIAGKENVRSLPAAASYPVEDIVEGGPIREKIACPLCGASGKVSYPEVRDYLNRYNTGRYAYCRCGNAGCSVLWRYSPPPEADVPGIYDHISGGRGGGFGPARLAPPWLAPPRPGREPGKILVVGCFNDGLLSELKAAGWDVTGFGTSGGTPEKLRGQGIDMRRGILDTDDLGSGRFDRILLANSLEHCGNPQRLLAESFRLLKPGGDLCLATPNVFAASRFLFGRYWFGLNAPRHRIIHSRGSLRKLLTSAGFRSVRIETSTRKAEEYAMRSLHGMRRKWTSLGIAPGTGEELLPRGLRVVFIVVNRVTGRYGDECDVFARKPS